MKRIYIAGAISSANPLQFLANIRRGVKVANAALQSGYAVFVPHIDFQLFLGLDDGQEISVEQIQAQSMAWLEASDAVLLVPGWRDSVGTQKELARAAQLTIPVFYRLECLKKDMPPC